MLDLALQNLLSPAILFFILGLISGALGSDLSVPKAISKALSMYLMAAIGLKGGMTLRGHADGMALLEAMLMGAALSFLLPFLAFALLRTLTRLNTVNAVAVSAHFGSVSVVTFITVLAVLDSLKIEYESYLVAVMAIMETPAILGALLILRFMRKKDAAANDLPLKQKGLMQEVFLNSSIVILLGSLAIGALSGPEGMEALKPFFIDPFKGVLCMFLLDIGLLAARKWKEAEGVDFRLIAFGIYMPIISGLIGCLAGVTLGLSMGGVAVMATLCASASYIAVPAAMRIALPESNPAIYVTLSLCVTFPFNIIFGIPLYLKMAEFMQTLF